MKKRYVVVGDLKDNPAEGMEVITNRIYRGLAERNDFVVNTKTSNLFRLIGLSIFYKKLTFVFCHGPGRGAVLASFLISLFGRQHKTVFIASRPDLKNCKDWLLALAKVDKIISPKNDLQLQKIVRSNGIEITKQFIGVDTERLGSDSTTKSDSKLADKAPLFLHVGHIRRSRGLDKLIKIKKSLGDLADIMVVASPSLSYDQNVYNELEAAGVIVSREYVENIGSVYRKADAYLFTVPTASSGAVDLPLSVVESLATKTPVYSTKFGMLQDALRNTSGVIFFEEDKYVESVIVAIQEKAYKRVIVDEIPLQLDLKNLVKYL